MMLFSFVAALSCIFNLVEDLCLDYMKSTLSMVEYHTLKSIKKISAQYLNTYLIKIKKSPTIAFANIRRKIIF